MCFVAVVVCTTMTTTWLLVQLCKKSEETIYETCGGTLSRESTRWVCNFVYDSHRRALNWTLQRWTVRTAAWKTEDTSWKAVSAIYLDNVTCHGDCECNLIVNYSSRARRERKLKCQIDSTTTQKVKRTINQSGESRWLKRIENTWKMRIIIVMNWAWAADNRNSYLLQVSDSIQFTIFCSKLFSTHSCRSCSVCRHGRVTRSFLVFCANEKKFAHRCQPWWWWPKEVKSIERLIETRSWIKQINSLPFVLMQPIQLRNSMRKSKKLS